VIYLIHQLVEEDARQYPDREAARFRDQRLSYGELFVKAQKLAALLRKRGVRRGDRVGIYQNKSIETPIALYGIMMAGAAYVPIDPSAPAARVDFVLRDCGIRHLVTQKSKIKTLQTLLDGGLNLNCLIGPPEDSTVSAPSIPWAQVDDLTFKTNQDDGLTDGDLAYIIYTSGSTGTPKGIMHTHRSGLSYARWAADNYALRGEDRLANHVPIHFDISTFDYFAGAVAGSTTVVIPEEYLKFPPSYAQLLAKEEISVFFTVPFALIQLLLRGNLGAQDFSKLRWIIFGGEPFPVKHLRKLMDMLPQTQFNNMYGPAEVNGVTNYTVAQDGLDACDSVPIGKMALNTEGRIVDAQDQIVPRGEAGELLVRSATMMVGYWERQDLNAQAFYRESVSKGYEHVFYRTGDLVREMDDENLIFLGRKDRQVKIRGYRVELDEVEAALCAHEDIEEAGVYTLPDEEGSNSIVAAATVRAGAAPTPRDIDGFLRDRIPLYAIPKHIEIAELLPRTTTGKIDRRALKNKALSEKARLVHSTKESEN
jgi:amino acid adenylation domain-containing protein